eukprot:6235849-Pyramimonas_sp.AAC.1
MSQLTHVSSVFRARVPAPSRARGNTDRTVHARAARGWARTTLDAAASGPPPTPQDPALAASCTWCAARPPPGARRGHQRECTGRVRGR